MTTRIETDIVSPEGKTRTIEIESRWSPDGDYDPQSWQNLADAFSAVKAECVSQNLLREGESVVEIRL